MKAITISTIFFTLLASVPTLILGAEETAAKSLLDDPELLNTLEIFMAMSDQERQETIQGLMEAVGYDPSKRSEMEMLVKMLPQMQEGGGLPEMILEDEFRKAQHEARRQIEGQDWDSFWAVQAEILDATIASGQLTPEQAAHFKTDEEAWKAQLKTIYDDLKPGGNSEL